MNNQQITRFTSLWTQAQPSVFAFISTSIINFADAEDVLQRVAAVVVTKFEDYDDSRPFVGWAIGIARLEILRYLRDQSGDRHDFIAESLEQIAESAERLAPELDDRRRALVDCKKRLEGRSRDVLEKRYADGMKTGAIADSMGMTAGSVSTLLNRVYRKLRECIDHQLALEATNTRPLGQRSS